nr:VanZ family protein [Pseudomonas sp.]
MYLLRVVPFFAVLAVILFSGLKPEPVPQLFDHQDKLHHLLGFAALMFTLRLAFSRWHLAWAVFTSLSAALLIELVQGMHPYRMASAGDMLANAMGVLLGWGCAQLAFAWYARSVASQPAMDEQGVANLESASQS